LKGIILLALAILTGLLVPIGEVLASPNPSKPTGTKNLRGQTQETPVPRVLDLSAPAPWIHVQASQALQEVAESLDATLAVAGHRELQDIFSDTLVAINSRLADATRPLQNERSQAQRQYTHLFRTHQSSMQQNRAALEEPLKDITHLLVAAVSTARRGKYEADRQDAETKKRSSFKERLIQRLIAGLFHFTRYSTSGEPSIDFYTLRQEQAPKDFGPEVDREIRLQRLLEENLAHPLQRLARYAPSAFEPFFAELERLVLDRNLLKELAPDDCSVYL
jgi:hypothetical protein